MQNPFSDLIPQNAKPQQPQANPFADLIPQGNAPRGTQNEGRGFFNDIGRRGLAIAGSAAQNTIKDFIPSAMNMFAPGSGDVMSKTTPISGAGKNVDFYKELGVDKGLGSSILQEGLEFAPYMVGAKGATGAAKAIPKAAEMLSKLRGKYPKSTRIGTEIAENALAGGAMAANKDENVGFGAALGGLSVPAGYVIAAPFKAGAKALAQSSIPGMTERATKKLKDLLTPEGYMEKLKGIFTSKAGENKANWKKAKELAKNLDESLTYSAQKSPDFLSQKGVRGGISTVPKGNERYAGYDSLTGKPITEAVNGSSIPKYDRSTINVRDKNGSSASPAIGHQDPYSGAPIMENKVKLNSAPYNGYIDSFINKINSMEPAMQQEYRQAIKIAEKAKEIGPQSFEGMMSSSKNINRDMKDFMKLEGIDSLNSASKEFLGGLKNILRENFISANKGNGQESAMNAFSKLWEKANKSHKDLQEFYKNPNKLGTPEEKKAFKAALRESGETDGALIGQFMPKPSQTGTRSLEHLEKLFGSKKDAQDSAKSYLNKRPLNNGNTILDASTEYAKLSPQQRTWIYGKGEDGKILKTINDIRKSYGKEPERSFYKMFSHPASSLVMPAMVGSAAGYYGGEGKHAAGAAAATLAATMLAKKGAGKLSPDRVRKMLTYSKARAKNPGRYINPLSQSLLNSEREDQ